MKPFLIVVLWVFAVWYLAAAIALLVGASEILGPIAGLAAGGLVLSNRRDQSRPEASSRMADSRGDAR